MLARRGGVGVGVVLLLFLRTVGGVSVVVGSFAARGHIQPMLPIGALLCAQGHDVRIAVPTSYTKYVAEWWSSARAHYASCDDARFAVIDAGAGPTVKTMPRCDRSGCKIGEWSGATGAASLSSGMYDALMPAMRASPPDIVVADFMTWGLQDVGDALGVPVVLVQIFAGFAAGGALARPVQYSGYTLGDVDSTAWRDPGALLRRVVNCALPAIQWLIKRPLLWELNALRRARSLAPMRGIPGFDHGTAPPRAVIVATAFGFEVAALHSPLVTYVGPLLTPVAADAHGALLPHGSALRAWLDDAERAQQHVVLVAFGSRVDVDPRRYSMLHRAFLRAVCGGDGDGAGRGGEGGERAAKFRVLLVMRKEERDGITRGGVHSCGGALRLATFPIAQRAVLRHPALGAFVSHGGVNGVFEAIDARVPLVVAPFDFDQADNAARVADSGVGLRAGNGLVWSGADIVRAMETIVFASPAEASARAAQIDRVRRLGLHAGGAEAAARRVLHVAEFGIEHLVPPQWRAEEEASGSFLKWLARANVDVALLAAGVAYAFSRAPSLCLLVISLAWAATLHYGAGKVMGGWPMPGPPLE